MTEPAPESPAEPAPAPAALSEQDLIAKLEQWAAGHFHPHVADARIRAAGASLKSDRTLAVVNELAEVVSGLAHALPADAPEVSQLIPRAEAAVAAAAKIAEDLAGAGM
jgi:hypothetical protein